MIFQNFAVTSRIGLHLTKRSVSSGLATSRVKRPLSHAHFPTVYHGKHCYGGPATTPPSKRHPTVSRHAHTCIYMELH